MNSSNCYISLYVAEPFFSDKHFNDNSKDYCYYLLLIKWNNYYDCLDFFDVHEGNYNVRELASWEHVIKPRIHERLERSNTFVLILSSNTRESWAINEEIDYGINRLRLPVIVIYPEFNSMDKLYDEDTGDYSDSIKRLWNRLPRFKEIIESRKVDIKHLPLNREILKEYLKQKKTFSCATIFLLSSLK